MTSQKSTLAENYTKICFSSLKGTGSLNLKVSQYHIILVLGLQKCKHLNSSYLYLLCLTSMTALKLLFLLPSL